MTKFLLKLRIFICLILCLLPVSLFAEDFYWEAPEVISSNKSYFPSFAVSPEKAKNKIAAVVWQDVEEEKDKGNIWLSIRVCSTTENQADWYTNERFAGPFTYSGEIPDIHSITITKSGKIAIAALTSPNTISIFTSIDNGKTFSSQEVNKTSQSLVAPRIYTTSKDELIIFATQGENESFLLLESHSEDGNKWSAFSRFTPSIDTTNAFIPVLCATDIGDLVLFQASFNNGKRLSYQLYSTYSTDGCKTWSPTVMITDEKLQLTSNYDSSTFNTFHNQQANLLSYNSKIYLAWERTYYASENAQIYTAELSNEGLITTKADLVSSGSGNASRPILFTYNDTLSLLWTDNSKGSNSVYFAQKNGLIWNDSIISASKNDTVFGLPIVTNNGKDLNIFWQENESNKISKIIKQSPDRSVQKPSIRGISFTDNSKSTSEKTTARVVLPTDSSGIAGFSYIWTQDPNEQVPNEFMRLPSETEIVNFATNDGVWYLKTKAVDYAGNWSESSSISYIRDTTPPSPPKINNFDLDSDGFLLANTFTAQWGPSLPDDISGYTFSLDYVGDNNIDISSLSGETFVPPQRLLTQNDSTSFTNRDNGTYAFSVSAIDSVGNISKSTTAYIKLNKYIPYTIITSANYQTDEYGAIILSIIGKGFNDEQGKITQIYIDKDGIQPYDIVLTLSENDYKITSNRRISGINLEDVEEGMYKIGILHSERGLYFTRNIMNVTEKGTVKTGNYSYEYKPSWKPITSNAKYKVRISDIVLTLIFIFALFGFTVSTFGIVQTVKESVIIKQEVRALITGDVMPLGKEEKTKKLKQRGMSLKYKIVLFTASLVVMIIILVAVPLGLVMTRTQEETLSTGLQNQVTVLMDSLATGAKAYLPSQNILELSFLPQQAQALSEAKYVTITGLPSANNNTNLDYVWATNDSSISDKIDGMSLTYGNSRLTIDEITQISQNCAELNEEAANQVSSIAKQISDLTREGISLALRTNASAVERRDEIQTITRELNEKLTETLSDLSSKGASSIPAYNNQTLDRNNTSYLFYKPVMYRQGSEDNFVRGIVLVEINTESLITSIEKARNNIIFVTGIIALLGIAIGVIVSLLLASIIVKPIRKLSAHVSMIRDTGNKAELEGKDIAIKSKDEIGLLGDNINDMTHGLVEAAVYENMLLGGKEVQRAFLPLDMIDEVSKIKLSVGHLETDNVQFFGYYEGAKGVSGDYFDFKKLDDKYFALIKCDVSGKGSPAALIMAEVAALFCDYLKDWSFKKNGTDLSPLVYKINDHLEARNLKGKFAAFTLGIFDTVSGDIYFCNAGDNLIHIYDASESKKKTITLPETPASGSFPSFMVEMKGGFPVKKLHLDKGDVLFLYTDGIEEAKRMFRNEDGENVKYRPETNTLISDKEDKDAIDGEEMSPERVNSIIEAVFAKQKYTLEKLDNPIQKKNALLEFDFSNCTGSPEEAVMALVSVEKVFRLYKDPHTTNYDHAVVDKKIDAFLQNHFLQYEFYCKNHAEHPTPELKNEYMYYTNLKEDEQFDDLTLVAIKKK